MKQRTWVLTVMATIVYLAGARAQAPTHVNERPLDAIPIDYELTSDGSRAVVRGWTPLASNADVITVWDTSSGLKLAGSGPTGFCSMASAAYLPPTPSDAVRVVGTRAVLIADNASGTQTLIDVVDTGSGTTPPVCLANFAIGLPLGGSFDIGGKAHDLEITPDGKYAVVNCRNYIVVVDLSTATIALTVHTGANPPSWATQGPMDVMGVDSVAVTNERAIVVQGAADPSFGSFYPLVWLLDLTLPSPAAYRIDMYDVLKEEPRNYDPHDVAITPPLAQSDVNDRLAVVTTDHATMLFDLTTINTAQPIMNHVETHTDGFLREYSRQVDSVELTHDNAVVIGWMSDPPTSFPRWSVKVFSLRHSPTVPDLTNLLDESGLLFIPHDLFINGSADAAVVTLGNETSGFNIVVKSVSTVPVMHFLGGGGGTPYADWVGSWPAPPLQHVRVSDSVLTASVRKGGSVVDYAVTLGGVVSITSNTIQAIMDVIDLSTPSVQTVFVVGDGTYDTMPSDLDYSSGSTRMFVRCKALPDEPPPATSGRDLLVVNLGMTPLLLEIGTPGSQIGGSGPVHDQVDSMIVKRLRAISVSYEPNFMPAPRGLLHTSTNP